LGLVSPLQVSKIRTSASVTMITLELVNFHSPSAAKHAVVITPK
jgi:hypothetical protein